MSKPQYFDDLSLNEMLEQHDYTYMMSDDYRAYQQGRAKQELIYKKIEESGGWTKELVDKWNEHAPNDDSFQKDYEWIKKYSK